MNHGIGLFRIKKVLAFLAAYAPFLPPLFLLLITLIGSSDWIAGRSYWFNNDHLAPFDYLAQLSAGRLSWSEVTHARIPSVWPDYLIAFVSRLASESTLYSFSLYYFFQVLLCVSGLLVLVAALSPRRKAASLAVFSGVALSLLLALPWYREIFYAAGLPARHGGNLLNVLSCFILIFVLLRDFLTCKHSLIIISALFCLSIISSFSNRLYFVQTSIPLLFLACLLASAHGFKSDYLKKSLTVFYGVFSVFLGALIGYAQYYLSFHQCEDVASALSFYGIFSVYSNQWFDLLAQPFASLMAAGLCFSIVGLVNVLSSRCQFLSPSINRSVLGQVALVQDCALFLIGSSIVINTSLYMFLPENLLDKNLWRYLLVPAYLLPVGIFIILSRIVGLSRGLEGARRFSLGLDPDGLTARSCPGWPRALGFGLVLSALAAILMTLVMAVGRVDRAFSLAYYTQVSWLEKLLKENKLSNKLGYVADPPWESRRIEALSSGRVKALSISTDGNPRIFPHSRYQFINPRFRAYAFSPEPEHIDAPGWVLASPKDFDRMVQFFGEPLKELGCFEKKGCLYLFDSQRMIRNTSVFLSTWQSERYGCLKGDAEMLRSRLTRVLRHAPLVGSFFFGN